MADGESPSQAFERIAAPFFVPPSRPDLKAKISGGPVGQRPVAKKAAFKKTLAKKPATKKPVAKKSITKKPVTKTTVAKQPASSESPSQLFERIAAPIFVPPSRPDLKSKLSGPTLAKKLVTKKPVATRPVTKAAAKPVATRPTGMTKRTSAPMVPETDMQYRKRISGDTTYRTPTAAPAAVSLRTVRDPVGAQSTTRADATAGNPFLAPLGAAGALILVGLGVQARMEQIAAEEAARAAMSSGPPGVLLVALPALALLALVATADTPAATDAPDGADAPEPADDDALLATKEGTSFEGAVVPIDAASQTPAARTEAPADVDETDVAKLGEGA